MEAAAGFVFFLTRTPFKAFFASFFAGAALGLAVVGGLTAAAAAPIGGGLFAAFSRAATALRKMSTRSGERPTDTGSLSEVFELFAVHLFPETLLFSLLLEYGVEEQHLIFFQCTELVSCPWARY